MPDLSLSTDQLSAFVELARRGSLREAAESLMITEQGVRNRLIALEQRLGAELYKKCRGVRRGTPLTSAGKLLLPRAVSLLEQADGLRELFQQPTSREIRVVASQYLIAYSLIDAVVRFHQRRPDVRVRLLARKEQDIEQALLDDPELDLGVAAPLDISPDLEYTHLFSMDWRLIAAPGHPLLRSSAVTLRQAAEFPLIVYEPGSTGRTHVMEAFRQAGLTPQVEMEATNTDLVVRMVEARLGAALVPLHPSGAVTRGRRIQDRPLRDPVRRIDSGILRRKGEKTTELVQAFMQFVMESQGASAAAPSSRAVGRGSGRRATRRRP
ncbi:MAG: LysR substrate-binding domain-containing protein [Pirellulales bacterium]